MPESTNGWMKKDMHTIRSSRQKRADTLNYVYKLRRANRDLNQRAHQAFRVSSKLNRNA